MYSIDQWTNSSKWNRSGQIQTCCRGLNGKQREGSSGGGGSVERSLVLTAWTVRCAFASVVVPCQIVFTLLKDVSPLEACEWMENSFLQQRLVNHPTFIPLSCGDLSPARRTIAPWKTADEFDSKHGLLPDTSILLTSWGKSKRHYIRQRTLLLDQCKVEVLFWSVMHSHCTLAVIKAVSAQVMFGIWWCTHLFVCASAFGAV